MKSNLLKNENGKVIAIMAIVAALTGGQLRAEEGTTSTVKTQEQRKIEEPSKFTLGVVGLFSNSTMTATTETDFNGRKSSIDASASGSGVGFGIIPEVQLSQLLGIELGLFFDPRKISDQDGSLKLRALTATPMVRFHVVPQYLSLGAGAFVSQAIGKAVYEPKGYDETFSANYKELGLKNLNWGAAAAVGGMVPVSKAVSALLEVRYLYGLAPIYKETVKVETPAGPKGPNRLSAESKINVRALQVLLGAKFNL